MQAKFYPSCFLIILVSLFQYDTLVTIVTTLKSCVRAVTFDLAARAEYKAPERMERTVYLSPLAANVTPDMVKVLGMVAGRGWWCHL